MTLICDISCCSFETSNDIIGYKYYTEYDTDDLVSGNQSHPRKPEDLHEFAGTDVALLKLARPESVRKIPYELLQIHGTEQQIDLYLYRYMYTFYRFYIHVYILL